MTFIRSKQTSSSETEKIYRIETKYGDSHYTLDATFEYKTKWGWAASFGPFAILTLDELKEITKISRQLNKKVR